MEFLKEKMRVVEKTTNTPKKVWKSKDTFKQHKKIFW